MRRLSARLALAAAALSVFGAAPQSRAGAAELPGTARIQLSGSVRVDQRARVSSCDIAPPGHSLTSGLSMNLAHDAAIESGGVHLSGYKADGTYAVPLKIGMFAEDPLQANFLKSSTFPRGSVLEQVRTSTLKISISQHGKAGMATLHGWRMTYPDNAVVSGTFSWTCP